MRNITCFPRQTTGSFEKSRCLWKTAGFILADVQSDVLSPSCMHVTAFPLTNSFVNDILWLCSMRRCFKSLMSRHFHRSCLKANKGNWSKSEETRQVEYAYNFWKCTDAVCPKLSKSVNAYRNTLQLVWHSVVSCALRKLLSCLIF